MAADAAVRPLLTDLVHPDDAAATHSQWESARADLSAAGTLLNKYFDARSRRTQIAQAQLQQIQANLHTGGRVELEDTLNALTTAAAGR